MTKQRIVSFYREAATVVKQANELAGAVDQITAQIDMAKAASAADQVEKGIAQRAKLRDLLEKTTALACSKLNRSDLAGCEGLLRQFEARLREVDELEQGIAQAEAAFEMAVECGDFSTPEERTQAEGQLSKIRDRLSTQIRLADALVPNKPVLLSL